MIAESRKAPLFILTHEFFPTPGGIATYVEEMAAAACELGHEVEVWAPAGRSHGKADWPFRVRWLPMRGTQDLACQAVLFHHLFRERRRIRQGFLYLPEPGPIRVMSYLHGMGAFRARKLILTFHGTEVVRFRRWPVARLLIGKLIRKADRLSTVSAYARDLLEENFPSAKAKCVLTPGALRRDFQTSYSAERHGHSQLIVLTVGRIHARKGQLYILQALRRLPAELRRRLEYHIVGRIADAKYARAIRDEASLCGFPVHLTGPINDDELRQKYQQAHLFAMTSMQHHSSVEGFGLVYLEASAHGLPIIAHHIGGVPEAVAQGETGWLVDPTDFDGLVRAFTELLSKPELRYHLGENGRKWALRHQWIQSADTLFSQWNEAANSVQTENRT